MGNSCFQTGEEVEIADGITHRKYLNIGWFFVIPLSFYISKLFYDYGYNFLLTEIFCIYNYWLCRLIDPDTDHLQITVSESSGSRVFEKIPFIGGILKALWLSYTTLYAGIMLIFGGHRNPLSHSLIISTIIRILYFHIPIFFISRWIYFRNYEMFTVGDFWNFYHMNFWFIPYILTQLIFMSIGDSIHLLLDTEIVKGVLYKPLTSRNTKPENFRPKYNKFIEIVLTLFIGYIMNKGKGIKNLIK